MYVDTKTQGFGYEVKKRIMLGSFVLSSGYYDAYYIKAQKVRSIIKAEFDKIFESSDLILSSMLLLLLQNLDHIQMLWKCI